MKRNHSVEETDSMQRLPRSMVRRFASTLPLLSLLVLSTGCENLAFQQVRGDQIALKFYKLPLILGGGISGKRIPPGSKVLLLPWEELIRLTNTQRTESWGTGQSVHRALAARSSDGNEVSFEVTVLYQISQDDPGLQDDAELKELVTKVANTDEGIQELVVSQVRALVRQFANRLATRQFLSSDLSSELRRVERESPGRASDSKAAPVPEESTTFDSVKRELEAALGAALSAYHLELIQLSVTNPRFVRYKDDDAQGGHEDDTYQTRLVDVQREQQAIKREGESRKTQEEIKYGQKEIALKEASKILSIAEAEAERIGEEARFMLQTKQIEKDAIEKSGRDMLASMRAQIEAVAGKGGEALLRLDIARELSKSNASFIVLNQGSGGGSVDVRRTDTNDLIKQLGLLEALTPKGERETSRRTVEVPEGDVSSGAILLNPIAPIAQPPAVSELIPPVASGGTVPFVPHPERTSGVERQ